MTQRTLHYLGPEGSFTHQAALDAVRLLGNDVSEGLHLHPSEDVPAILSAVEHDGAFGVIAWENNVEGYVVPNLDALIDADNVIGLTRLSIDIAFDAFVRDDDAADTERTLAGHEVLAHPHGLAQCRRFIEEHRLKAVPTTSNAAACRDLLPGQIALGPAMCGELYSLRTLARGVQDYEGAHTDFLVLGSRDDADKLVAPLREDGREFETIIVFIPLSTGSGVLANLLDLLRDEGLNMSSFMSRPIKGHDGTYSFIATIDAAPWEQRFRSALEQVLARGDWVKTIAVYPRSERPDPPVDAWMLPNGGVRRGAGIADQGSAVDGNNPARDEAGQREKEHRELLW